jgi:hypothetical protein
MASAHAASRRLMTISAREKLPRRLEEDGGAGHAAPCGVNWPAAGHVLCKAAHRARRASFTAERFQQLLFNHSVCTRIQTLGTGILRRTSFGGSNLESHVLDGQSESCHYASDNQHAASPGSQRVTTWYSWLLRPENNRYNFQ